MRRTATVIPSLEATKAVNYHRKDSLVISTSASLREWNTISTRRDLDVDLTDCMDRAPAVGLGLALARPDDKVLVLDCDATLRTDLSSMATIAESNPENLVHFVFDDSSHLVTGGLPIPGMDQVDLISVAQGAGYSKTYEFDKLEEFLIGMEDIMNQTGPIFVLVKVFRDEEILPFPERTMAEGWAEVRETLLGGE